MNPFTCNHTKSIVIMTTDENKNKINKQICAHCGIDLAEIRQVITNKGLYKV